MGQIELGKIFLREKEKECFCSKREGWGWGRERERERERECPSIVKPQLTCIVLTPPRYLSVIEVGHRPLPFQLCSPLYNCALDKQIIYSVVTA